MIISEYFAGLAKRLGIPEDSEELKPLLGMTAVIPETLSNRLTGLMTESEAKNNLTVKNHFIGVFGSGLLDNVTRQAKDFGVNVDELEEEFKVEKSSGKKVERLMQKVIEAQEAKVKALKEKDPEALTKANDQIKAANAQVTKLKEEYEAKLKEKDSFLSTYKLKNELSQLLSKQLAQTPWSEVIPEQIRETVFNEALKAEMVNLGTIMHLDGDKLVLKQSADPVLDFHYQNKAFSPAELVAKVMTDNKLIAVAPKATEPTFLTGNRTQSTSFQTGGEGGGARRNIPSAFAKGFDQSMSDAMAASS